MAAMATSMAVSARGMSAPAPPRSSTRSVRGSPSWSSRSGQSAAHVSAPCTVRLPNNRYGSASSRRCPVAATAHQASRVLAVDAVETESIKQNIAAILEGKDQGLFGLKAEMKSQVHELVERLEAMNTQPTPLEDPSCVAGEWRVLYSTIKITGAKRTKLGLREFVRISDMVQIIDPEAKTAVNEVRFNVMGLGSISGALTITATYEPVGDNRVAIKFESSVLEPAALQKIFNKNYDMLLGIFNPEGWLDITYVDDTYRVGRDDKGNVFILERPC